MCSDLSYILLHSRECVMCEWSTKYGIEEYYSFFVFKSEISLGEMSGGTSYILLHKRMCVKF